MTANHHKNRQKICLICLKYQFHYHNTKKIIRFRNILESQVDVIKANFIPNFSFLNDLWPSVMCYSCRNAVNEARKGIFKRQFKGYNLDEAEKTKYSIKTCCKCFFCSIVQKEIPTPSTLHKENRRRNKSILPTKIRCDKCLSEIKRGINHKCSKATLVSQAKRILKENNVEEALIAKFVVEKKKENVHNLTVKNFKGKPTTVFLEKPSKVDPFTLTDMMEIQKDITGSDKKSIKLLKKLRKKKMSIEPNLFAKLSNKIDEVHTFFRVSDEMVEVGNDLSRSKETRKIVFCYRIKEFISFVLQKRQLETEDILIKFSCDSGGGSLKVSLSVVLKSHLIEGKQEKLGSVQRIFLIAIAQNMPETNLNLRILFRLIGVTDLCDIGSNVWFTGDLKIYNRCFGVQDHSCLHPCVYCDVEKSNLSSGNYTYRTVGSIRDQNDKWLKSGGIKKKLSEFQNCFETPVFEDTPNEASVIELLAPNELHLMTGDFNYLYKQMEKIDKDNVDNWSQSHHARKSGMSGDFNGNDTRKLLRNYESLRNFLIPDAHYFASIIGALNNVVTSCFGQVLKPNWKEAIDHFAWLLQEHGIPFTPKLHITIYHIPEFIEMHETALGPFSEQAAESLHHQWEKFYMNFASCSHETYGQSFLKAVVKFNTMNV